VRSRVGRAGSDDDLVWLPESVAAAALLRAGAGAEVFIEVPYVVHWLIGHGLGDIL